jgi:3-phenylpropionate/trans-cinnamate dioxygenase ferredoxin subunit
VAEFVRVGSVAEVHEGEIRGYELPGVRLAVASVGGRLFGFGEECPYRGCLLSEGTIDEENEAVVCARDGSAFALGDGEPVRGPAEEPLPVFAVRTDDGWIEVGIG